MSATKAQLEAMKIIAEHGEVGPSDFYRLRWPGRRPRRGNNGEDTTGMIGGAVLARLARAGYAHQHYQGRDLRTRLTEAGYAALRAVNPTPAPAETESP